MLNNWNAAPDGPGAGECKKRLKARRLDLAGLQQRIRQAKLPILVLLEGWGAAGKGSAIRSLIRELDPRFFQVRSVGMPTAEERRWPFLKRHFAVIPPQGKLLFLDSGWMEESVREFLRGDLSEEEFECRMEQVRIFERQLASGGYLLVKLFFHIDAATQRERLEKLSADKDTAWRCDEEDWKQNKIMKNTGMPSTGFWRGPTGPGHPGRSLTEQMPSAPSLPRPMCSASRLPPRWSGRPRRSSRSTAGRCVPSSLCPRSPWTSIWRSRSIRKN